MVILQVREKCHTSNYSKLQMSLNPSIPRWPKRLHWKWEKIVNFICMARVHLHDRTCVFTARPAEGEGVTSVINWKENATLNLLKEMSEKYVSVQRKYCVYA